MKAIGGLHIWYRPPLYKGGGARLSDSENVLTQWEKRLKGPRTPKSLSACAKLNAYRAVCHFTTAAIQAAPGARPDEIEALQARSRDALASLFLKQDECAHGFTSTPLHQSGRDKLRSAIFKYQAATGAEKVRLWNALRDKELERLRIIANEKPAETPSDGRFG